MSKHFFVAAWLLEFFGTAYVLKQLMPQSPAFYCIVIAIVLVTVLNWVAFNGKKAG